MNVMKNCAKIIEDSATWPITGSRQKICIPVWLCWPGTDHPAVSVFILIKDRLLC